MSGHKCSLVKSALCTGFCGESYDLVARWSKLNTFVPPKIECVVTRVTEEQALKVRCPTCGAKRGEKCELSTGLPPDRAPLRSATGGLRTVKFSANSESTETKGGSSYPTLNRKSPLFLSLQVSRA